MTGENIVFGSMALAMLAAMIWKKIGEPYFHEKEREHLIRLKYQGKKVFWMLEKQLWVGETSDELRDSLGHPCVIDREVLKTKIKEEWKYYPRGARSFGLCIYLNDGEVVGWKELG